jgi:hypothetical protein
MAPSAMAPPTPVRGFNPLSTRRAWTPHRDCAWCSFPRAPAVCDSRPLPRDGSRVAHRVRQLPARPTVQMA